jgi:hypothetical protein
MARNKRKNGKSKLKAKKQSFAPSKLNSNHENLQRRIVNTQANREQGQNFINDKENKKLNSISFVWEKVKKIWIFFVVLATLIGIIGFIQFEPKIDVSTVEPFEPNNPFSTPFIITNQGLLSVSQIESGCDVIKIQASHNSSMSDNKIIGMPIIPLLKSGGKETTFCPEVAAFSPDMYEKAELEIKINFRAWWYPINQLRNFRFIGTKNTKGEFKWIPKTAIDAGYLK